MNGCRPKKPKSSASKPDWGPEPGRCAAVSLSHSAREGSREGVDIRPLEAGPGSPLQ